jgi:hypothetical protein
MNTTVNLSTANDQTPDHSKYRTPIANKKYKGVVVTRAQWNVDTSAIENLLWERRMKTKKKGM